MAKKRLNKKVALIGSLLFVFVMVAAIALILYLNRDPNKFITRGDAAFKAARETTDEQTKEALYIQAEEDYRQAHSIVKTDVEKVAIVFKLAEIKCETEEWRDAMQMWNGILRIDDENIRARFSRLKYFYLLADTGALTVWKEVESQSSELLVKAEEQAALAEYTSQWDPFEDEQADGGQQRLGFFLHLARGRAVLEMTKAGVFSDQSESLTRAIEDLTKAKELDPGNVDVYWYLAMAVITNGEIRASRGDLEARERSIRQGTELLEQVITVVGDKPRAHINILLLKLLIAQRAEADQIDDRILALESEHEALVERFPSSAEAYLTLSRFYRLRLETLDKAVEAAEKAVELDAEKVEYARNAANIRYQRFCIRGNEVDFDKSVEIATYALTLPGAQDKQGPLEWANRRNKISLLGFLAECYIEHMIEAGDILGETQKEQLLAKIEAVVRDIEQLLGSGEAPLVVKWRGLLELVRGNRNAAVKQLYTSYKLLRSDEQKDSLVCYRLAKVFENTSELGAVREFLYSALRPPDRIDERKPEVLLDYAEVLLKLRAYGDAQSVADYFERKYWANERSRRIRMQAHIGSGNFVEVEEELARTEPNSVERFKINLSLLRSKIARVERALARRQIEESSPVVFRGEDGAEKNTVDRTGSVEVMMTELQNYREQFVSLAEKLLLTEPNSVNEMFFVYACNYCMSTGKKDRAQKLVEQYLGQFPDSTVGLFYKRMLAEPGSGTITEEKRMLMEEEVLSNITDPVKRAVNLGKFYRRNGKLDKAAVEFNKIFKKERVEKSEETAELWRIASSYLFEIALTTKDYKTAEQLAEVAREENLDDCGGLFYAGRLAVSREEYTAALENLNECLKERPVFSHGFLLRSNINSALGETDLAVADAQKAVQLNPQDGTIAKGFAVALYQRNSKLGDNVTANQLIETKRALLNAIRLNPRDIQLQSFYAEYISSDAPEQALAMRQQLLKSVPSVENALLLGKMAMRLGRDSADSQHAQAMLAIAGSAFAEALNIDPQSAAALAAQAEYYRLTGQEQKAVELLTKSGHKELLWVHYFKLGKFNEANNILHQAHQADPSDEGVVRGLLLVAEKTADDEAVKEYSEKLIKLNDSIDNRLQQIQSFLKSGLIKESENKLQSFKEKFPEESRILSLEAWLAMRQGRLEQALKLTNLNLESGQDNAVAWRLKGRMSLLRGEYNPAINALKESKSLSDELITRYYLAKAYLGAGRADDAVIELKSALSRSDTSETSAAIGRGMMQLLEETYLHLGRKDVLRRFYDETLAAFAESMFWHNRAASFAVSEGEFDRAEQLYGKAIQIAAQEMAKGEKAESGELLKSFDGYLNSLVLGAGTPQVPSSWNPGKLDQVFQAGRKHVDDSLAPVAYFRMAEAKVKLGDKATAVQYCRNALTKAFKGSQEAMVSGTLRRIHSLVGAEEVLKYCRELLETDPEPANLALFTLKVMSQDYNQALGHIDRCLEIAGTDSSRRVSYVTRKADTLGLAYTKTSDNDYLKRAVKEYESLLSEMPNNIVVLNNLAYMLASNNEKLDDALKYARRAYDAKPNNPGFLDTYAFALHKNGSNSDADQYIQASVQQYEQGGISVPADVYEHLGMIKEALGLKAEALAAYRLALKTQGLSDAVKKRIEAAIERLLS